MKCICKLEVEKLEKDLKNLKSSTLATPGLMPDIPPLEESVDESASGSDSAADSASASEQASEAEEVPALSEEESKAVSAADSLSRVAEEQATFEEDFGIDPSSPDAACALAGLIESAKRSGLIDVLEVIANMKGLDVLSLALKAIKHYGEKGINLLKDKIEQELKDQLQPGSDFANFLNACGAGIPPPPPPPPPPSPATPSPAANNDPANNDPANNDPANNDPANNDPANNPAGGGDDPGGGSGEEEDEEPEKLKEIRKQMADYALRCADRPDALNQAMNKTAMMSARVLAEISGSPTNVDVDSVVQKGINDANRAFMGVLGDSHLPDGFDKTGLSEVNPLGNRKTAADIVAEMANLDKTGRDQWDPKKGCERITGKSQRNVTEAKGSHVNERSGPGAEKWRIGSRRPTVYLRQSTFCHRRSIVGHRRPTFCRRRPTRRHVRRR